MTKQLCPCSELDWRDVDMSLAHHPNCPEINPKYYQGELGRAGLHKGPPPRVLTPEEIAIESAQVTAPVPDYHVTPGSQITSTSIPCSGISSEIGITGHCPSCHTPYSVHGSLVAGRQVVQWPCAHCETDIVMVIEN